MLLISNVFFRFIPFIFPFIFKTKKALLAPYSHRLWQPHGDCTCKMNATETLAALNIPSAYEDRVGWRTLELGKIDVRMFLSKDIISTLATQSIPMGSKGYRGNHAFAKHNATCVQLYDQPTLSQLEYLCDRDLLHFPFPEERRVRRFPFQSRI